jgi:hypothetical protein
LPSSPGAAGFAQNDAARVLWLPSIRTGMNYNKHGNSGRDRLQLPTSRGLRRAGSRRSGADRPRSWITPTHLTDAIHQPRITGFAWTPEALSDAVINDQLLNGPGLLTLRRHQRQAIAAQTLDHGRQLAEITVNFARRSRERPMPPGAAVATLENEVTRAGEAIAVASARWRATFGRSVGATRAAETTVVPIELARPDVPAGELVGLGLSNRPELAASRSLVCEAVNRLRREQNAPWLPSIVLGVSYGGFGAGRGGQIDGGERFDFDGIAYWEPEPGWRGPARTHIRSSSADARGRVVDMVAAKRSCPDASRLAAD